MIRVLNIITCLNVGGAEMMLSKIVSATDASRIKHSVISLMGEGPLAEGIRENGAQVFELGLKQGRMTIGALVELRRLARLLRPDVIQGWMYHGNLAAEYSKIWLDSDVKSAWNIRQSLYQLSDEKRLTQAVIRLGAMLSNRPARIVYNSETSALQHEGQRYSASSRLLIANGFDTDRFRFSQDGRKRIRDDLSLDDNHFVIGTIGRAHAMKDHASLFRAAESVMAAHPAVKFVIAGSGITADDAVMGRLLGESKFRNRFLLLGPRQDIPELLSAFDLFVLSSSAEAFPNVIGEAMSCSRMCVATDVGDVATILGGHGTVVPPKDPDALARGLTEAIAMPEQQRQVIGNAARQRVIDNYALPNIVKQYENLYTTLAASH